MYLGGNRRTLWYSSFCAFLTIRISKAIQLLNEGGTLRRRKLYSRLPISNLQGKSKKVRFIGRSKQMTRNKEMQVSCTLHFKGSKKYIAILKLGKKITKAWLISTWLNIVFNWTDQKVKTNSTRLFWNEFTVLNCSLMPFLTWQALKTWFKLSRVKFYRNNLKGNKTYFDLAGDSNYPGFELSSVKLQ